MIKIFDSSPSSKSELVLKLGTSIYLCCVAFHISLRYVREEREREKGEGRESCLLECSSSIPSFINVTPTPLSLV